MKQTTTAKLPKKTSAKVNDPDNPAWTEDMLGAPVIKRGRGPEPQREPPELHGASEVESGVYASPDSVSLQANLNQRRSGLP